MCDVIIRRENYEERNKINRNWIRRHLYYVAYCSELHLYIYRKYWNNNYRLERITNNILCAFQIRLTFLWLMVVCFVCGQSGADLGTSGLCGAAICGAAICGATICGAAICGAALIFAARFAFAGATGVATTSIAALVWCAFARYTERNRQNRNVSISLWKSLKLNKLNIQRKNTHKNYNTCTAFLIWILYDFTKFKTRDIHCYSLWRLNAFWVLSRYAPAYLYTRRTNR